MKRITFFLAGIFCLAACSHEVVENPIGGPNIPEDRPQIELRMPDAEKVSVYSTATEYECTIDNIWVLLFKADDQTLDTLEFINVASIVNNGQPSQLLPQLSFSPEDGRKIVCIANTDINTNTPPSGITYSNINEKFTLNDNHYYYGNDVARLPMYGEFKWGSSSGYTCTMTRAVAKIQVQMGETVTDATGTFSAENVSYKLYQGARGGHIQPPPTIQGIANDNSVLTSEIYYLMQKDNVKEHETNLFLYEYPSATRTGISSALNGIGDPVGDTQFHRNRQFILLAKGNGSDSTFYRLDFYDSSTNKFFDTKRNHHYIFTINKVRSEGYNTRSEAINNPGSNIVYSILIKDEANAVKSNGQYAIVTGTDSVKLYTAPGSQTATTVRYDDPSGALNATVNSITVESSPAGAITLNSPTTITSTNTEVKLTINTAPSTGTIVFKLGNITHKVHVTGIPVI